MATTTAIDNDSVPIVTVHSMSSGVRLNPSPARAGRTTRGTTVVDHAPQFVGRPEATTSGTVGHAWAAQDDGDPPGARLDQDHVQAGPVRLWRPDHAYLAAARIRAESTPYTAPAVCPAVPGTPITATT